MKRQTKKIFISLWLLTSFLWQAPPIRAQITAPIEINRDFEIQDRSQLYKNLLRTAEGNEYSALLEKIFGSDAGAAKDALGDDLYMGTQASLKALSQ
ncbi:MAG TPA: hypothetical protein VGC97_04500 [Pyrinomonadaceae bacterium]|jgi:hypothetical protein